MISVEMEDVLAVLQLCKPYIIGIVAALVIGIVIMIACRRMCRDKRFLIRREAAIAMVLAVVVCVNMICFGPMATLIGLATGNGTLSDETNEEAAEAAEEIMEDGIVLLKNESLLPLNETKKLNIFGWESINPAYGGAGSGGINDLYDIVSLNQGLENAGFSINQDLVDFIIIMVQIIRKCQFRNRAGHYQNHRQIHTVMNLLKVQKNIQMWQLWFFQEKQVKVITIFRWM